MSLDPDQLAGTDIKYSIAKLTFYWLANKQIDDKETDTTSVKKMLSSYILESFWSRSLNNINKDILKCFCFNCFKVIINWKGRSSK